MGGVADARKHSAATARLTPAHLVLLGLVQVAVAIALLGGLGLALAVLFGGTAMLGAMAWFAPFRLLGPAVSRGHRPGPNVAVVFDEPPAEMRRILATLEDHRVPAAFVVSTATLAEASELVLSLRSRGHEVLATSVDGSPTWPWLRPAIVRRRVQGTLLTLQSIGCGTAAYVPPRRLTHPAVRGALIEVGAFMLLPRRVRRWKSRRVRAGDVVLLSGDAVLAELAALKQRGLQPCPLAALLQRPITSAAKGCVEAFYDGLAERFDAEQERPSASPVRTAETAVVWQRLAELVRPGARVLELGAGTGRFTTRLLDLGARVTAVDVSSEMLARLQRRVGPAAAALTPVRGDFMEMEVGGDYDLICAFSSFEYVADFERLISKLAERLVPGGMLYFTTARRGTLRWFVQIGNAMRQGLWLHARSEADVRAAARAAGLSVEHVGFHGLRLAPGGGMLLEVLVRRPFV